MVDIWDINPEELSDGSIFELGREIFENRRDPFDVGNPSIGEQAFLNFLHLFEGEHNPISAIPRLEKFKHQELQHIGNVSFIVLWVHFHEISPAGGFTNQHINPFDDVDANVLEVYIRVVEYINVLQIQGVNVDNF